MKSENAKHAPPAKALELGEDIVRIWSERRCRIWGDENEMIHCSTACLMNWSSGSSCLGRVDYCDILSYFGKLCKASEAVKTISQADAKL
jgi:hypothetical protein